MKTNFKKFTYWSVAMFFAIAIIFASCAKEENIGPSPEVSEEVNQEIDFSEMVGGYIPTPKDIYESIPLAKEPTLKATQAIKYLTCPSVGNQGTDGACVGWATAYAARSIMTGAQTYFSPSYVYNQIKISNCASGSYPVDAINLIYNQGVSTWSSMPYVNGDCYTQPNNSQKQNAANYKISGASRVSINYSSIRAQVAAGKPVIVAGKVDNAFNQLGYNKILNSVSGSGGGHAYCVVGYNDDYRCFKILNSWGTNWSTNGYGWISYDIVGQLWSEAYIMY